MLLCPYKRQISMLRLIALQGIRAHKNVEHLQHRYNVMYRDRSHVVEFLLQLENKRQIMQNNVETQRKHMDSLYIGSLSNLAFPMACFTCIVTSVNRENPMKHSIELYVLYGQGKHL